MSFMNHSGDSPSTSRMSLRSSLRRRSCVRKNGMKIAGMPTGTNHVADMARRMKDEVFGGEFVVKLADERFQFRSLQLEAELGNLAFEQFLVAEIHPVGDIHRRKIACGGMTGQAEEVYAGIR